ncbi:MAG: hypothetical protein J6B53_04935 [Clostridia bacterium]|nr:hypothetical protein [Clostridia bacterium]
MTAAIGSLIDGVVIGQFLGVDAMAAFGLVSPVVVYSLVGSILPSGARNRFTMMIGSGDVSGARGIFSLSMVLNIGTSVLMMLGMIAFAAPVCALLGASGSAAGLLDQARDYLMGLAVGLPAVNAYRVLQNYMAIDNDRELTMISALVLTLVDVVLDVLIAVSGGGTLGMGLATSFSYYAVLGVLLVHFRRRKRLIRFSWKNDQWKKAGSIIGKGLSMGGRVSNTARSIMLNKMVAATAAASAGCIAAYSVHRQADSLLNPFVFGISETVATLAGILMGEENRPMLKRLTKDYFAVALTLVLGVSVLFWFMCPRFAAFFIKDDPQTLAYGIRAARCYAIGLPLYSLNRGFFGYLEGRGKVKIVMLFSFLSEGAYLVLAAAAMLPVFQADAIWYAFPVCQVLLIVTVIGMLLYMNCKEKSRPADFWEWVLALPKDFDVPEEDRIDRRISRHDEVIALSQAAWDFCDAHGCDNKRKHAIALAVEELAMHTVVNRIRPHHGNTIDIRILKKGDEYIVRVRDDCEIFDPLKQLQLYDRHVPMHHMGLQIAIRSAKDVQYTTMLKLNNLVLRV